jgi:hypothetical protein
MKRLPKRLFITLVMAIVSFVALGACNYFCYGSRLSKASAAGALSAVQNPRALDLHDFEERLSVRIFGWSNIAGFVGGSRQSALR